MNNLQIVSAVQKKSSSLLGCAHRYDDRKRITPVQETLNSHSEVLQEVVKLELDVTVRMCGVLVGYMVTWTKSFQ